MGVGSCEVDEGVLSVGWGVNAVGKFDEILARFSMR